MHTCETYAYEFQLLLCFVAKRKAKTPSTLELEHIDTPMMVEFLNHLEQERGNAASTRNGRLAAIKSFFRFIEYRVPSCIEQARQIRAIPAKRTDTTIPDYLSSQELQWVLTFELNLAEQHNVRIIANDIIEDLEPRPAVRLAALDRFQCVYQIGSF